MTALFNFRGRGVQFCPTYSVISVGKDNAYGHPHDAVVDRIVESGAIIYRADLDGYIACTSDGENVTFQTEK